MTCRLALLNLVFQVKPKFLHGEVKKWFFENLYPNYMVSVT